MTILFDLDGTLIDSTEAILESFDVSLSMFGEVLPDEASIKAEIGYPLDVMFRTLGVSEERVWDHVAAYKQHYRKISCEKTVLLPNALEAVTLAREHATLGIVTTKTAEYSREMLEYMGIMHHFDVLIGREDVTHPKPHPEPVLKAISKLKADRNRCWLIGDTPMDICAAKAADIQSVAVTCGYADEKKLSEYTSSLASNALEAVKFIVVS
ncbi:HAD family hydrolase [Sulfurovum sp. ST-21]|uniref:phosphoglycolate phosphatase n=1 Tax=Sulfurovum indicum TaxID=2779528 RepID=A0A7M1S5S5_9BACT|nr:HAD family hydrolase [Sulfurovum indicum]QOR61720.1 HAD family hydrolase [Sulfurovum indicum]